MNEYFNHTHSQRSSEKSAIPYKKRLPWHRWAESNSLAYLNVMDYQHKKNSSEEIPWFDVPITEEEILKYSQVNVFSLYKLYILDKIAKSDNSLISDVIQSGMHVCNIYNLILDADQRTCLYIDVIHLLHEKQFQDPACFLTLCNALCGNSTETKMSILSSLMERHRDKKTIIILNYILNSAQAARFNFWGIWFIENERETVTFCPVTWALLKGNFDQLILLLQYGFDQNPGRICIYDKYYHYMEKTIYSWLKTPLAERSSSRSAVITEVLFFLIQLSKIKSRSKLSSLERCFRLLWSVNQIPFVTESELLDEIYRRFEKPPARLRFCSFPSTYTHFTQIVECYEEVMPRESTSVIQPRSLQQLCKCEIRRTLARAYNLPQGIKKLCLPKRLLHFLDVE